MPVPEPDFIYRAGCTLLINPNTMEVRRVIRTPGTIKDDGHLERMRKYLVQGASGGERVLYEGPQRHSDEPFALLHSEAEE